MAKDSRLSVQAVEPRDAYEPSTVPVQAWIDHVEELPFGLKRLDAWAQFIRAAAEVAKHPSWEWSLRTEPRVGYDAASDSHYFIFKIDNNGTTFLVSENPIKGV
jgi:hypothetical protein